MSNTSRFDRFLSSGQVSATFVKGSDREGQSSALAFARKMVAAGLIVMSGSLANGMIQKASADDIASTQVVNVTSSQGRGQSLRDQFIHDTLDREGKGITTVTSGRNTGRFFFNDEVTKIDELPNEEGVRLHGKKGKDYVLKFSEFESKKVLFTTSGIQIEPNPTENPKKNQGVTLDQYRAVVDQPEASYIDMIKMAVEPAQVEKMYLYLYWNPHYEEINDDTLALSFADIGVNTGKAGQDVITRNALDSLGVVIPRMQDALSDPKVIDRINKLPAHEVVASVSLSTARYYAGTVLSNPEKYGANLDGWMNRAKSLGDHPEIKPKESARIKSMIDKVKESVMNGIEAGDRSVPKIKFDFGIFASNKSHNKKVVMHDKPREHDEASHEKTPSPT